MRPDAAAHSLGPRCGFRDDPEQRLAGLAPEQRLAGLAPEQRLAGLDRDHQALALPVELLRVLPEEYVRSLAPEVQTEIQRRLQLDTH